MDYERSWVIFLGDKIASVQRAILAGNRRRTIPLSLTNGHARAANVLLPPRAARADNHIRSDISEVSVGQRSRLPRAIQLGPADTAFGVRGGGGVHKGMWLVAIGAILTMTFRSIHALICRDLALFGVAKTVYDLVTRAINRVVYYKIFKGLKIETIHPGYLEAPAGFEWLALEPEQLHELAKDPAYDFTEAFLSDALAKGDRCYGILDGDVLATYGWYSTNPTETSDDVTLHFNSDYVYMYKGYTLPQYRGRRLYAVAINRALSEYLARGYHGLVSYIESNNFSSLKSVRRLGYHSFGHVIVLKLLGRPWIVTSPGCRRLGFYFRRTRHGAATAAGVVEPEMASVD